MLYVVLAFLANQIKTPLAVNVSVWKLNSHYTITVCFYLVQVFMNCVKRARSKFTTHVHTPCETDTVVQTTPSGAYMYMFCAEK